MDHAEEVQRREIARLHNQNLQFKEEIDRETGRPIQLTPDERRLLAEKSREVEHETLNQTSVFDREDSTTAEIEIDSS